MSTNHMCDCTQTSQVRASSVPFKKVLWLKEHEAIGHYQHSPELLRGENQLRQPFSGKGLKKKLGNGSVVFVYQGDVWGPFLQADN